MATLQLATEHPIESAEAERADVAAARAEVVDILAGAIFALLLKGEAPGSRAADAKTHLAPVPA